MYELAIEFNIDRRTASDRLKRAGVTMRLQPPSVEVIDEIIRLYESGLSSATIGEKLQLSPQTVLRYAKEGGIQIRGAHSRARNLAKGLETVPLPRIDR